MITLWFLITVGGYNSDNVVYSPPMSSQVECEKLRAAIGLGRTKNICVPIEVPKTRVLL